MKKTVNLCCLMFLCYVVMAAATPARAEENQPEPQWRGGPHVGLTPYSGVFGAEVSRGRLGVTLGIPLSLGVKYYSDDQGYRWFVVAHAMHMDVEQDNSIKNVAYDRVDDTTVGVGFGYRWRWRNHWDLTASLSAVYQRERFSNDFVTVTEESVWPFPGLSFGYTF